MKSKTNRSRGPCLRPCVSIPNATTIQWSRKTLPSMQTIRRSSSSNGRLRNDRRRLADSATNRRDTALLDVPGSATWVGVGSNVSAYRRVDTPAATAASVCSSSGSVAAAYRKLGSGSSPSALRARSRGTSTWRQPSVTWLATLPPCHAGRRSVPQEWLDSNLIPQKAFEAGLADNYREFLEIRSAAIHDLMMQKTGWEAPTSMSNLRRS